MGLRQSLVFKYDQPELITHDQKFVNGLGSCKVQWTFFRDQISCEFCFSVLQQTQLDSMRYILAIAAPIPLPRSHHIDSSTRRPPSQRR